MHGCILRREGGLFHSNGRRFELCMFTRTVNHTQLRKSSEKCVTKLRYDMDSAAIEKTEVPVGSGYLVLVGGPCPSLRPRATPWEDNQYARMRMRDNEVAAVRPAGLDYVLLTKIRVTSQYTTAAMLQTLHDTHVNVT